MQTQASFVTISARQVALGVALLSALALFVAYAGGLHGATTPTSAAGQVVVAHQQAPDAQDRNDAIAVAQSTRPASQAPDAQDRNDAIAAAQTSVWSNQSPDAQERNQQLAK
jgi:hypothetical protein